MLLFSTAASAQSQGYLGIFTDENHTSWCGSAASVPGTFNAWIYALPRGDVGTWCAEFMLQMPADASLMLGSSTPNPDNSVIMGDLTTGVSFCFVECQYGWTVIYEILLVDTGGNQNVIQIVPHPDAGGPNFVECTEERPMYEAVAFNNLYVNYTDGVDPECSATATAERTWGAIKSLYTTD